MFFRHCPLFRFRLAMSLSKLSQGILDELAAKAVFTTKLLVRHGDETFDLTHAVGDNAMLPADIPDQPSQYPPGTSYCFDPTYIGDESFDKLFASLKSSIQDCDLVIHKCFRKIKRSTYFAYELRCSRYRVSTFDTSQFDQDKVTKRNTVPASNKKRRSSNEKSLTDRFAHHKLKGKNVASSMHRKSQINGDGPRNNRTKTYASNDKSCRCPMILKLRMNPVSGRFYLDKSSHIHHEYHHPIYQDAALLKKTDLTEDETTWLHEMVAMGLSCGQIAGIMTGYFNKTGREGEFDPNNIKNIVFRHQREVDEIAGIAPEFSVAEKTLKRLNE